MRKIVALFVLIVLCHCTVDADILEYIAKEDPSFKWEKVGQLDLPQNSQQFELKLTSQKWKDIVLQHRINFIKPEKVGDPTLVFLLITGSGSGRGELMYGSAIANGIGAPVAVLHDVPNQPLFGGLREDGLIAYTFIEALKTGDEEWPLLFSMTKAAVKAMDAIQEFAKQELGIEVNGFVVAGASKRGWTTLFTGAVDERVKGIIPIVYDNLDLVRQMEHQVEAWGDYSKQIGDYTEKNIPQQLGTEKGRSLAALVDPYTYRDRLTMPKLIVIGTNDEYWPLDALNLYYDDLVGEKYILYVPNKGHGVDDPERIIGDGIAFFRKVDGKVDFPNLSWDYSENDEGVELSVKSDVKPVSVDAWTAKSSTRDFRKVVWEKTELISEDSAHIYNLKKPENGYAAIFGEAVYESGGRKFFLSTNVYILGSK